MVLTSRPVILALAAVFLLLGCSKGGSDVVSAPSVEQSPGPLTQISSPAQSSRYLWGYWLIKIDPTDLSSEIVPVRNLSGHFNVLKFLEQGPCFDCFKLAGISANPDGTFNVNVQLRHPFPGMPFYTGFDVRGIAMFEGSKVFPVSGLVMSDKDLGEGEIVNADGYTTLYNPDTVGHGLEGYVKGNYADIIPPNSSLNAFKRYASDDPANTRNAFYADDTVTVVYQLSLPEPPNEWVFGYAVDASWVPPTNTPVIDPMTDFPLEANCPEPWKIRANIVTNHLFGTAGTAVLNIDVFDRGGADTHYPPRLECPELFDGEVEASLIDENPEYARYEVTITNEKQAIAGEYRCLISAEDKENDPGVKPWMDLSAYQVYTITPSSGKLLWAKRAGDASIDSGYAVTTLSDNSTIVTGGFLGQAEFGEGEPNETVLTAIGQTDIFIARYDMDGMLLWAKHAGGEDWDEGYGITTLSDDSVVVTGVFRYSATFGESEPNETVLTSTGYPDIFVARYDSNGMLLWAKRAGGIAIDEGNGIARLSDNSTVVTGGFLDSAVFGEGEPNETVLTSGGGTDDRDIFIARYSANGMLLWAKQAEGLGMDEGCAITTLPDNTSIVTGYFGGSATFGPGEANETVLTAAASAEVFIARYNPDGTLLWAKRAGGTGPCQGLGITTLSDDSVTLTGFFWGKATFGPGEPDETVLTSAGTYDVFIARYNPNGTLQWAKRAGGGGDYWDWGYAITALSDNSVVVTGFFSESAKFGEGEINETVLTSAGYPDIFIARYNPAGMLMWAKAAGGTSTDAGHGITALSDNSTVVTGSFIGSATFGESEPNETILTTAGGPDIFIARYAP
jgi:hypothetical protein